jgi:hypothetical protein
MSSASWLLLVTLLVLGACRRHEPRERDPAHVARVARLLRGALSAGSPWRALIFDTPPFDGSEVAQTMLVNRLYAQSVRSGRRDACADYAAAVLWTVREMNRVRAPYPTLLPLPHEAALRARCAATNLTRTTQTEWLDELVFRDVAHIVLPTR